MRGAAALIGLALVAAPAAARDAGPLKWSELAKLSDDQLARRIFGPLAGNLVVGPRSRVDRFRRDSSVWFWTRPRKDWLRPGICSTDRTIVALEVVPGSSHGDDSTLAISRIQTDTYYLVQNRAFADRGGYGFTPKELAGLDAACAEANPLDATQADDGAQLMTAFKIANELGSAARAGRAPAPIDCSHIHFSGPAPASEAECLKEISRLSEKSVDAVQSCGEGPVLSGTCIRIQTTDSFIYVLLDREEKMVRVAIEGIEDTRSVQ